MRKVVTKMDQILLDRNLKNFEIYSLKLVSEEERERERERKEFYRYRVKGKLERMELLNH